MGTALLPHHDAGERELLPQGPLWKAGSPVTLRVLILTLLWRGSLSQPPGLTLTVLQSVLVQEGLCVIVPCTFTYPASSDTDNPSAPLYGKWYKEPATVDQDPPVASSATNLSVSQETQSRFRLMGDPAHGDCSLQISDARWTDVGRYFFSIEKGKFEHTYCSKSDGTDSVLNISVTGLTEKPEIQISPARGLPGTLLAGEAVTVTCTAPGRCSGPPPRVTWTGPFSDTAQNISAQLVNGTWAHSSVLSFTPGLGDHGKELVCSVTYRPPQGPSTRRNICLDIVSSEGNRVIIGTACGLGVLIGLFFLGLYVIKLRCWEPAPSSTKAGETANGSQVEHTVNETSVIYSTVTSIPMDHKTPAARRTKGIQDGAATAQAPLGPGEPDELHYASVEFSKPQRKGEEPPEAPAMVYSEVQRK